MLFYLTHQPNPFGGWTRTEWPDGRSAIEQPAVAVQAFMIVMQAMAHAAK